MNFRLVICAQTRYLGIIAGGNSREPSTSPETKSLRGTHLRVLTSRLFSAKPLFPRKNCHYPRIRSRHQLLSGTTTIANGNPATVLATARPTDTTQSLPLHAIKFAKYRLGITIELKGHKKRAEVLGKRENPRPPGTVKT